MNQTLAIHSLSRRVPEDRLPYAAAQLLLTRSAGASPAMKLAPRLRALLATVGVRLTLNRCRAVLSSVSAHLAADSRSASTTRRARARLTLLHTVAHQLPGVPVGRKATARRALVVIGQQWVGEPALARVIVSRRWLADQLLVAEGTAAQAIEDLISAGVLSSMTLMRDERTRTFKLNARLDSAQLLLELMLVTNGHSDVDAFAGLSDPVPGSLADVALGADSPVWSHGPARSVHAGVFAVALADAVADDVADLRAAFKRQLRVRERAVRRASDRGADSVAVADLVAARDQTAKLLGHADVLRSRLKPAVFGGPGRPTAAREWLAGRPADQPFPGWLVDKVAAEGLTGLADERRRQRRAENRARVAAADKVAAQHGRPRERQTPEEWAAELLRSAGALPSRPADVGGWSTRVSAAWSREATTGRTGARWEALTIALRSVAGRVGMPESRRAEFAARVLAGE